MRIDKWYYIDSFRVEQGCRSLNYCYLDGEIYYVYKNEEKRTWAITSPKRWGKIFHKHNIKPFYKEVENE